MSNKSYSEQEKSGKSSKSKENGSREDLLLMDKKKVKGWRSIFEHNRHRNESFASRFDYRLTLLILTAASSLSGWEAATFISVQGAAALVPLFVVSLLFAVPFLFTEIFMGSFPGTGMIWSLKNAVPISGGIGIAMLIQAFLQLGEDSRNLGQLTIWTLRIVEHADVWNLCNNSWHDLQEYRHYSAKYNNEEFQVGCIPLSHYTECFTDCTYDESLKLYRNKCDVNWRYIRYRPINQYLVMYNFRRLDFFGKVDGPYIGVYLLLMVLFSLLASLSFRLLVKYGKYVVFLSFFLHYILIIVSSLYTRSQQREGFADLDLIVKHMHRGFLSTHTWFRAAGLVFKTYAIGHGAVAAIARRSHQGKAASIFKDCITIVPISFLAITGMGLIHLVGAPGMAGLLDPMNYLKKAYIYGVPWLWSAQVNEMVQFTGGTWMIVAVLWLHITKSLGGILIYYDTVRTGIMEAIPWKSWIRVRPFLPAIISAGLFLSGFQQFLVPMGIFEDAWYRQAYTDYIFKAFLAAGLTVSVTWIYSLRRAFHDVTLINESHFTQKQWVYYMGIAYGKIILPAILITSGITEMTIELSDPWYQTYRKSVTPAKIALAYSIGFAFFSISLVYALVKLIQQKRKGLPWKKLLQPTNHWGPCELRFWVGKYAILRCRYKKRVPLDSVEKEKMRERRQAVRGRRTTSSFDTSLGSGASPSCHEEEQTSQLHINTIKKQT